MDTIKKILVFLAVVLWACFSFADPYALPSDGQKRTWGGAGDTWMSRMNPVFNYFDATGGVLPEYPVVLGPLSVSGAGNSWLELGNNTSFTDVLTGKGGYGLLNWLPYAILNGIPTRLALYEELVSFAFDTYPAYEDSAHSSGIAVNGTTLAVYSETASKWLTVALTDSLNPTPTTPTLTSLTIPEAGTTAIAVFSEAMTTGAGGAGGWTLNTPTNAMTYSSGTGTDTLTFSLARTILDSDTPTVSYTQPTNGWESNDDQTDLASIVAAAVTNNSTQTGSLYTTSFSDDFNRADNTNVITGSSWTSETDTGGIGSILNNEYSIAHNGTNITRVSKTLSSNNTDYEVMFKFKIADITAIDTSGAVRTDGVITLNAAAGAYLVVAAKTNTSGDLYQLVVRRTNDAGTDTLTSTNFTYTANEYITIVVRSDVGEAATADGVCYVSANGTELLNSTGLADETRPVINEIRLGISALDSLFNQSNTLTYDDFTYGYK